ncbi:MAG: aminoacetone oxidase family FAD-binding enzyme [Acidobacteria bacterium]|nr:aminoacetone oxidase family FAD-binding enzyme [Acidobacteriota bacterium]
MASRLLTADIAIVGAGAAGLATAIFTRRADRPPSVVLLEGAKRPGAKILVSGGGRCNVANARVEAADFSGGRRVPIGRILGGFPPERTVAFFRELGVPLHAEEEGKLFPDSNRSRDVLDALLGEIDAVGARLLTGQRVLDVVPCGDRFRVQTPTMAVDARRVVLATGGRSLPKSGSDGAGLEIARRLGHTIVPTTPALTPLLLADADPLHRELSGVSQPVALSIWIDGVRARRLYGPLLWTHFGVSGPVALDASRHYLRAELERRPVRLTLNFCGGAAFDEIDRLWIDRARARPTASIAATLASIVPASVAEALLRRLSIEGCTTLAHAGRDARRRLAHALDAWPLPVAGARGYNFAEATAGGVDLAEIDPSSMESRIRPGLFLVGEMLDADGRLGGFNFQWAWATARMAAAALAAR